MTVCSRMRLQNMADEFVGLAVESSNNVSVLASALINESLAVIVRVVNLNSAMGQAYVLITASEYLSIPFALQCIFVCVHMYVCMFIYTYTHIYKYIYIYI